MPTKRMTTIRRRYINDDWCYQVFADNLPQDRDSSPFVPWTKLPPEVMCLISLCLMGLQEGLKPIAADEWQVPSRALESWTNSTRETADQIAYMERDFRFEETKVKLVAASLPAEYEIRVEMCSDPDQASKSWIETGFTVIGRVDTVLRGDGEPPERPAVMQARQVGATAVLYNLWPVKLKAIKRLPDQSIELASILADPPKKLRQDGFYVVKAIFLRK
ncbi:hypothetical protein LQ564_05585 [Massilia sp. G4R7]|uniref:Uncharacterized protein n=1 Tax=Massilia phyllostachyos TaxID=2898585 RepID=A0ABS8Q2G6_9BURK|nr:hypothetical protein [Massilia phyllostachyos]MCD2515784.1 hypothetical protein [Massilia phyllostachyos]